MKTRAHSRSRRLGRGTRRGFDKRASFRESAPAAPALRAPKASLGLARHPGRDKVQRRILAVGLFFAFAFTLISARAVHLQVVRHDELSARAQGQYTKVYTATPRRGVIYDARFRELAATLDVTSVAVRPKEVENPASTALKLSRALGMDETEVFERLVSDGSFVWVKRLANPVEVERVRALNIPGVVFVPERRRFYPNKELAAQVLGFCGVDGKGLEGLEYAFDEVLAGTSSRLTQYLDARGESFSSQGRLPVGDNLVLTLDLTVQYIAEKALARAVADHQAKSGMAVVMDPDTGAILAMAHVPFFNPNSWDAFPRETWRNRAVTDAVEPGSTLKVFMAAAALESGRFKPDSEVYCEQGAYRVADKTVNDVHPHGWLTLEEVVKVSSNIGAVKVGEALGPRALYDALRGFGFGEKPGVECPGETKGLLSHWSRWTEVDTGAVAFGQGVSVSALQLCTALCAVANGGELMRPYIVQAVTDNDGRLVKSFSPVSRGRPISRATAWKVRRMMEKVMEQGGTGNLVKLTGYQACGKTGTAQIASPEGGYARGRYLSSFMGFAPAADPEIAVVVMVEEPRGEYYGGLVAGPAFKEIAEKTLNYLGVLPDSAPRELGAGAKGAFST
ncbi:MAG: penicillin-binding protein 2 [Deltaproteobacteria bacterium]|nr:penicillin-binding protein 2 [Deltaproteobacteria bacterium]